MQPAPVSGQSAPKVVAIPGQPASGLPLADTTDLCRRSLGSRLNPDRRALLGQFMTPTPIGRFMAGLFDSLSTQIRVLDPGAGVGALTAAFAERLCDEGKTSTVDFVAYEIDPVLNTLLGRILGHVANRCRDAGIQATESIRNQDFVLTPPDLQDLFRQHETERFTHVIMNPPYRKISGTSTHRMALRRAGIETSNLYTGFMYLAAQSLEIGGEMVAIVPRSFCNGPYFKPFRERFFAMMTLRKIHIFEARDRAFRNDDVLQENIIVHAVRGVPATHARITASSDSTFDDLTERIVPRDRLIRPDDPDRFVHIAANELEHCIADRISAFSSTLAELGIQVSTGPVVDFRLRDHLRPHPVSGTVPVLYPTHFPSGSICWPKRSRKPNSILVCPETRKWLWPNEGDFVLTRRFTTKEEARRIVASIYSGDLPGELVGFENHLNVYHVRHRGLTRPLAVGLSVYLNSSLVDQYFRQFNGHTQVNATDLRSLRYPEINDRQLAHLTPGRHSELIREIIHSVAPRFCPGAEVIYLGDTGARTGYFEPDRLARLGVVVDRHGKLPDVVLYDANNDWLLLVESVTSHGPVDAKRHNELAALFATATTGLVYVTAFPSRNEMSRYLTEISWETEVWCADAPSHLIHFDGDQFLGPYTPNEEVSSKD